MQQIYKQNIPIIIYKPQPQAVLRLFLFHHAGGSHYLFRGWEKLFPDAWEICMVEYPGRGHLMNHNFAKDLNELVNYLYPFIGHSTVPTAFFGHSMGAQIAFELTSRLSAANDKVPVWLGISSRGIHQQRSSVFQHLLSDEQLIHEIYKMGGTPNELLHAKDLWQQVLKVVRADLSIAERESHIIPRKPLSVPISVYGSDNDHMVSLQSLINWQSCTNKRFALHCYKGGHFYLNQFKEELSRDICHEIIQTIPK